MRTTAYAYPWDVARLGADRVIGDLADKGIEAIDLAATYHPIDTLSPRGAEVRHFSSPRGAVHFPARSERYARIKPSFAPDDAIRAAWPAVHQAAAAAGVGLNSWTVLIFQPWMGDAYPDCLRVLPGGDPVGASVCPASADVQEYYAIMCADIVDQFGIEILRLEMAGTPAYDYGWLRPRILIDVPPLARQVLAVCFCPSCVRRGTDAGLDVEGIRRTCNQAVAEELDVASASEQATAERTARLVADPELHEFVVQHDRAAIELLVATTSQMAADRRPRVSTLVNTPYSSLLGEAQDGLVDELLGTVEQTVMFPGGGEQRMREIAAAAKANKVGMATFIVPVQLSVLVGEAGTSADDGDRVRHELRLASTFGVEEVNIYNYGLLRDSDVTSLLSAITKELP
jgi:hypothetical protein